MNWYKTALKQSEFYEFYAYQGLSDETFKDNPVILYEFIEKLKDMRIYYLDHLFDEIADELQHSFTRGTMTIKEARDSKFFHVGVEPEVNKKDYYIGTDKGLPVYDTWAYDMAVQRDTVITMRDEYKNEIMEIVKKMRAGQIDVGIINRAIYFFDNLPWDPVFGGPSWAEVTKWTGELYQIGPIEQEPYSDWLINRIRKLVMIIDTIHSLRHNTGIALRDLPGLESFWLSKALDLVKNIEDVVGLAYLSRNPKLVEVYKRQEIPFYINRSEVPQSIEEAFPDPVERRFYEMYSRDKVNLNKGDLKK